MKRLTVKGEKETELVILRNVDGMNTDIDEENIKRVR